MATCRSSRLIEALSTAPARLFGLPGGTLAPGASADLIVVDLDEPWIVQEAGIRSRSKNTCFEGARLQGKVLQTHGCGPHSIFSCFNLIVGGSMLEILAALVFGYLLGSIPFGLLITRAAGLGDVRKIGSGNIGATNVLRTGNKGLAALTLAARRAEGHGRRAGRRLVRTPTLRSMPASAAFLGHLFPVWLSFKGGKGVATYLGVLAGHLLAGSAGLRRRLARRRLPHALSPRSPHLSQRSSCRCLCIFLATAMRAALFVIMTAIVYYKHRANISRLMAGTEARIGAKE